jgi:hypothetical protein
VTTAMVATTTATAATDSGGSGGDSDSGKNSLSAREGSPRFAREPYAVQIESVEVLPDPPHRFYMCYTRYMFRGHCEYEGYCRQGPTTPAVAFKIVRETFLEPS